MAVINAKQFSAKTGFPLATVRAFCREGKLSHWKRGRVYWIDENSAVNELERLKEMNVYRRQKTSHKPCISRHKVSVGAFDYQAEIAKMKRECKSSYIAVAGDTKQEK